VYDNNEDGVTWNVSGSNIFPTPHSGVYYIQVMLSGPGDDWLITPKLSVSSGDSFSFWIRSHYMVGHEDFEVWLSTTENSLENFTYLIDAVVGTPYEWTRYSYSLNQYAGIEIYIAIRFVTPTSGSGNWIHLDDISGPALWVPPYAIADLSREEVRFLGRLPGQSVTETVTVGGCTVGNHRRKLVAPGLQHPPGNGGDPAVQFPDFPGGLRPRHQR
jgi:hypothetical protein